jgi:hypothetical protein
LKLTLIRGERAALAVTSWSSQLTHITTVPRSGRTGMK